MQQGNLRAGDVLPSLRGALARQTEVGRMGVRVPVPARGVITVGQFACGIVTISRFGIGLVSVSQFTIAGLALAQLAFAWKLIAQIGICIAEGRGQPVWSRMEILRRLG